MMKKLIKLFCLILLFSSCGKFEEKPFPLYMQQSPEECGPACLKMISDFYGGNYSFETLALISQMDEYEGTSMANISDAASMIGLHNLVVKVDYQALLDEVPYPAMLHWDGNHFLVIYKMNKDSIWLSDPAKGHVTYTKEEFLPHWIAKDSIEYLQEGYALLLETTDTFYDPRTTMKVKLQSRIEKKKKDAAILSSNTDK